MYQTKTKSLREWYGGITMRSSSVVVLFISITEAALRALEIEENSVGSKSVTGMVGKSNSIKKLSCDSSFWIIEVEPLDVLISGTFLAVKIPEAVRNSTVLELIKLVAKSVCAAANVAWPQILTCKRVFNSCSVNLENFLNRVSLIVGLNLLKKGWKLKRTG